jgi:hypothetical protein
VYLLIVYLLNIGIPWLGGYPAYRGPITVVAVPVGNFLARLFHSLKVSGRPVSRTVLLSSGQPFSRMQRSRMVRLELTNETPYQPPLSLEARL